MIGLLPPETVQPDRTKWHDGAPSVHWGWKRPKGEAGAQWFYNEVRGDRDPTTTYYCAAGWHRGYFGMQVNSPTERRIIFSVWDAGNEEIDRNKVADENRVRLIAKGPGVFTDSFGNEGTGGHSHLKYRWKTGAVNRFLVHAVPDGDGTVYSGYYDFPGKGWGLIASFRAPKDTGLMRGLYSFNEDFGGSGEKYREATFGNGWVMTDGVWRPLLLGRFTRTDRGGRPDAGAWSKGGRFTLWNGGGKGVPLPYGSEFSIAKPVGRPPSGAPLGG